MPSPAVPLPVGPRPVLGPGDPPPVTVRRREGTSRALVLCDHAENRVPSGVDLGVSEREMRRHIAWDPGARHAAERLMERLDACGVFSGYSRLVIDINRPIGDPTSIPEVSDGTLVPGNRGIGPDEVERRAAALWRPYHAAVAAELERLEARDGAGDPGCAAAIVSVHTFTPTMHGFRRPWQVGILWDDDERMPLPMLAHLLRRGDVCVGDNQPYTGRGMTGHTADVHGTVPGRPHLLVELRQDLVGGSEADAHRWADLLAEPLARILADPGLYRRRRGRPAP